MSPGEAQSSGERDRKEGVVCLPPHSNFCQRTVSSQNILRCRSGTASTKGRQQSGEPRQSRQKGWSGRIGT